jgi:hypothetical protein
LGTALGPFVRTERVVVASPDGILLMVAAVGGRGVCRGHMATLSVLTRGKMASWQNRHR